MTQAAEAEAHFTVDNQGTIVIITPNNEYAAMWLNDHVDLDFNGPAAVGGDIFMEPRYAAEILNGYYSHDEGLCDYC